MAVRKVQGWTNQIKIYKITGVNLRNNSPNIGINLMRITWKRCASPHNVSDLYTCQNRIFCYRVSGERF